METEVNHSDSDELPEVIYPVDSASFSIVRTYEENGIIIKVIKSAYAFCGFAPYTAKPKGKKGAKE